MNGLAANRIAAPLSDLDLQRLDALVGGFSADKLVWASGYLAGLAAAARPGDEAAAPAVEAAGRLTILYGSQTGNGRRLAEAMQADAAAGGLQSRALSMADYRPAELRRETLLAVIVSTHGEGDPPDDAEPLHEYLFGPKAPRLESLGFTVLALGDSSYEEFCRTGKDFDERLEALGAKRLHERVDCDVDYEEPAAAWVETALERAREKLESAAPRGVAHLHAVPAPASSAEGPLLAEVLTNQRITASGSTKRVHHVEFSVPELAYEPGDALALVTHNPPELVEEIPGRLRIDAGAVLEGGGSLADALLSDYEITVASRSFVERYADASGSEPLAGLLQPERRGELTAYLAERQIVDIVSEHPAELTADQFVGCLRRLKPRLYSIASSPLANPDEVHLTVAAVEYTAFGRRHWGAASSHIVSRLGVGDEIEVRVEPNPRFRLPEDASLPVIMIGPGTGVAPFRAFLEHREAVGATGRNWLFFGDRNFVDDFLYQLEWARFRKRGVLHRMDVAFSRDQTEKCYVQHRIRERSAELYAWLEEGAHVYVCGDASRMAPDVHSALAEVIGAAAGSGVDGGEQYLKELKRAGRYQRDVY